jgi:hypothetical protein
MNTDMTYCFSNQDFAFSTTLIYYFAMNYLSIVPELITSAEQPSKNYHR